MNLGEYSSRVVIKSKTEDKSGSGAVRFTENTVATVWASIEGLRGSEYWAARQVASDVSVRVRVRRTSQTEGITPKMWAVHGSIIYDIEYVQPLGIEKTEIELLCKRRV